MQKQRFSPAGFDVTLAGRQAKAVGIDLRIGDRPGGRDYQ